MPPLVITTEIVIKKMWQAPTRAYYWHTTSPKGNDRHQHHRRIMHNPRLIRHTKRSSDHGFTLVELLVAVLILGSLSAIGTYATRKHIKRAHEAVLGTQLSAASRKLVLTALDDITITEATCLDNADLQPSNEFVYSCAMRDGAPDIFDISVKPLTDIGVGGILSFGIGRDKICWDTCDATGRGDSAVLAKSHLSLNENCSPLTRNERNYDCNCETNYVQTGNEAIMNCTTWITCRRVGWRPIYEWVTTCETCTEISYTNENGVIAE